MTPVIENPGLVDGRANNLYVEISPFDKPDMFPQNHLDSTEDEKTEIFQSSYDFSGPDGNSTGNFQELNNNNPGLSVVGGGDTYMDVTDPGAANYMDPNLVKKGLNDGGASYLQVEQQGTPQYMEAGLVKGGPKDGDSSYLNVEQSGAPGPSMASAVHRHYALAVIRRRAFEVATVRKDTSILGHQLPARSNGSLVVLRRCLCVESWVSRQTVHDRGLFML